MFSFYDRAYLGNISRLSKFESTGSNEVGRWADLSGFVSELLRRISIGLEKTGLLK